MELDTLSQDYWNNRYEKANTGWDLGMVSPPLKGYIDQLSSRDIRILIVGCGNAYEAQYLLDQGFTDVTLLDIAPLVVKKLQQRFSESPQIKVILGDFFTHEGQYDLVLEQTFFCAISTSLRKQYVLKMHDLLTPNGLLVGVLFNIAFPFDGPPFGGNEEEYRGYFSPFFELEVMEACYNSVKPRAGTELFINLRKRMT